MAKIFLHTFRVHFEVGAPLDFVTETAAQARDKAKAERPGEIIRKIKVVKEAGNGQ